MGLRNPHAIIDKINAAQDRLIARKLRTSPRAIGIAKRNLTRWMAEHHSSVPASFVEWHRLLTFLDAKEIAAFLCSDTPMARRLRQSSPFAGVLTKAELERIRRKHEKARA